MTNDTAGESWADLIRRGELRPVLREAGQNVDELGDIYLMVQEFAPEQRKESLLRQVAAVGRAARKTAERLAKEAGIAVPARTSVTAPADVAAPAPAPAAATTSTPAPVIQQPASTPPAAPTSAAPRRGAKPARFADRHSDVDEQSAFASSVRKELTLRAKRAGRPVPDVTGEQMTAALAAWHHSMQVEGDPLRYVSWTGWTGVCLAMWLADRYPKRSRPVPISVNSRVWALSKAAHQNMRFGWLDLDQLPQAGRLVVELDVNAQFLAAMSSALLGDGDPVELGASELAEWELLDLVKLPGYLVLAAPPDLTGLPAHARAVFGRLAAGSPLPTPLAVYLVRNHKVALEVAAAVVWHTVDVQDPRTGKTSKQAAYGKRLGPWAKVVEAGRVTLMTASAGQPETHPAALAILPVKRLYSQLVALLRSPSHNVDRRESRPTGWLRPDWYDMIIATANANALRALDRLVKAGWTVHGGLRDSIWISADALADIDGVTLPCLRDPGTGHLAPLTAVEISTKPGKWKISRVARVTENLLTAYRRRRPKTWREALQVASTDTHDQDGDDA